MDQYGPDPEPPELGDYWEGYKHDAPNDTEGDDMTEFFKEACDLARQGAIMTLRGQATLAARKGNMARAQELRARALFLETGKEASGEPLGVSARIADAAEKCAEYNRRVENETTL